MSIMKLFMSSLHNVIRRPHKKFFTFSRKKKILLLTITVIGILFIIGQIATLTQPPPYTVQKVSKGAITEYVTEAGNISSGGKVDVYSPTDGIVTDVYITNGDAVAAGDELFKVTSSATEQEAQAAYSNYLTAVAARNSAQATANSLRADMYAKWELFRDMATNSTYENGDDSPNTENRLASEFQIAQDMWIASEKKYKDQQTTIAQGNAQVASALALYQATQDAIVKAPNSGIISNLSISNGGSVGIKSVSLVSTTTTPALVIRDENSTTEIVLQLSETDISKIKVGQKANITINAADNKEYKGTVARVDTIGTDTQGVVTYNVYLRLHGADSNIRPGMTVDAEIVTKEIKDVLSVPNSSIKPYKGGRAVRVPDMTKPEKYRYVPVTIGVRGAEKTQIIKGIDEGAEVITALSNETLKRPGPFGN